MLVSVHLLTIPADFARFQPLDNFVDNFPRAGSFFRLATIVFHDERQNGRSSAQKRDSSFPHFYTQPLALADRAPQQQAGGAAQNFSIFSGLYEGHRVRWRCKRCEALYPFSCEASVFHIDAVPIVHKDIPN